MTTNNQSIVLSAAQGNKESAMEADDIVYLQRLVEIGKLSTEGMQQLIICWEAAKHIDPETAEVKWEYMPFDDPYGVLQSDHPTVRQYFARSPASDIWVAWSDLPEETEISLWEKHKQTDVALQGPTSCWAAFVHSKYFREVRYNHPKDEKSIVIRSTKLLRALELRDAALKL
jgi:hypothetical protein